MLKYVATNSLENWRQSRWEGGLRKLGGISEGRATP